MIEILEKLKRVDRLIRIKGTGSPKELAERIGVSERTAFQYIDWLKKLGAPIKYNRIRESYVYTEDGGVKIGFEAAAEFVNS